MSMILKNQLAKDCVTVFVRKRNMIKNLSPVLHPNPFCQLGVQANA